MASWQHGTWHHDIVLGWQRATAYRGNVAKGHRGKGQGGIMSDMAILGLAAFIFVGLPAIIFCIAFAIDRLAPSRPESKNQARKHRAF